MVDVICMGSATIDMFTSINPPFKSCVAGEKILITSLEYDTGGGGTNSAVALARMGCDTAYLGKIGHDTNAERILSELRKENVNVIPVKRSKLSTSFSVIMESRHEKDRIIYVYKGAANDLSAKDFGMERLNASWLYLATQMGRSFATAERVVKYMKRKGTKVLFNPSEYLARKSAKIRNILRLTDVIVLNREEAGLLVKSKASVKELARLLMNKGPNRVIITEGSKGVHYFDRAQYIFACSPKVRVVSTAGAGDAFTSGFLAGIIRGESALRSVVIGMNNASSTVQKRGAKHGLLSFRKAKKGRVKCIQQDYKY